MAKEKMRLQKYMAQCGVASRRKAEIMIQDGRVSVNGETVLTPGFSVEPEKDRIVVDGRQISSDQKVYILLNKPKGYVCTVEDRHAEKTVFELISVKERIHTVGRLDKDTEGMLLLTNDGALTFHLTHPSHELDKTYIGLVKGIPEEDELNRLRKGIRIKDETKTYCTSPAKVEMLKKFQSTARLKIVIHEGKKRQIRKMCESIGHPIIHLRRDAIGDLKLEGLRIGEWRYLTEKEIEYLKRGMI